MTATTASAVELIYQLDNLVHAQLNNCVELAKKIFDIRQGTHGTDDTYQDNSPRRMQTQSHVDLQEIVPNIDHSGTWGFKQVSCILQAPELQDDVSEVNKTPDCTDPYGDKTKLCIFHFKNKCKKTSAECPFAHTQAELTRRNQEDWVKYKTAPCQKWPRCERGQTCIFAHGTHELRLSVPIPAVYKHQPSVDWPAFELDFCTVPDTHLRAAKLFVPNAATDLLSAVKALLLFRNSIAHMSGYVRAKTGISVATYNFMLHVITVAGRCIAAALDANAVVAFEKSMAEILTDRKPVATHSALATTAATFTPAAAAFTVAPAAESKCKDWSVQQVIAFFEGCKFPTDGVVHGQVDGKTLELLCADKDAQATFCTPLPDGFGFGRLLYVGRFQVEMEALNVSFKKK